MITRCSTFRVTKENYIFERVNHFQAVELMIADALVQANDYLEIASHIQDPSQYWKVKSFDNNAHTLLLLSYT